VWRYKGTAPIPFAFATKRGGAATDRRVCGFFERDEVERRPAHDVYTPFNSEENEMKKILLIAATVVTFTAPAMAEDVGVQVGPVGAGVTVGEGHRDYDRDRVQEKTIVKEREPSDRTTVIKKEHGDGTESKTVIHKDY
jgi:hypothetical protein